MTDYVFNLEYGFEHIMVCGFLDIQTSLEDIKAFSSLHAIADREANLDILIESAKSINRNDLASDMIELTNLMRFHNIRSRFANSSDLYIITSESLNRRSLDSMIQETYHSFGFDKVKEMFLQSKLLLDR